MRIITGFFVLVILVTAAALGFGYRWANSPMALLEPTVDFRIVSGSSLRAAVQQAREAGIDLDPNLFVLLARIRGATTGIKAGSYSVKAGITPEQFLAKIAKGEVSQGEALLLEGQTFRQWIKKISQHPDLNHRLENLSDAEIAARLGMESTTPEGWLFPDTYLFDKQSSDEELLQRAHRAMRKKLDDAWAGRAEGLPYRTPYEALIMASIVEKETGRSEDRALVAAVFVNRLRKGMLLQTDPTVIYGLGDTFDGNLRKRDLQTDTAYNTYTRPGLPPSPIAMPSQASLQAALHPANSDALYFVARGDGSSVFSRTLEEHNKAVNKYQRSAK